MYLPIHVGKKKGEPDMPPDPKREAFPGLCLPDNQSEVQQLLQPKEGDVQVAKDALNEVRGKVMVYSICTVRAVYNSV